MNCHRCGATLPASATGCPRCDKIPPKTKRLMETDLHKTRALVMVERCENCGFLIYPNDNECSACGAWVKRPWKQPAVKVGAREAQQKKWVWVGVAISLVLLCLTVVVWHFHTAN